MGGSPNYSWHAVCRWQKRKSLPLATEMNLTGARARTWKRQAGAEKSAGGYL